MGEEVGRGEPAAPACAGATSDLEGLDEGARLGILVAQTVRFSVGYLRWVDAHTSEGLTYSRLRLLEALQCGGPAIMRDLAGQLGLSARNMTAMVDALEDAGLAQRRPHPNDRRATLVELTPTGIGAATSALEPGLQAIGRVFDALTPAEQGDFLVLLGRLSAAMLVDTSCSEDICAPDESCP
jgi:DNA-binding MarR family transcriptional regulator